METIVFERLIQKSEERTYFTLPFSVPEGVESMTVRYAYARHERREDGAGGVTITETAIVDLGLNAPGGHFVGASGSDRTEITISPFGSSHGYESVNITPGEWEIIVGAYKIPEGGVPVRYEIALHEKRERLFFGDMHTHTTGSDGVLTPEELCELAARQGLDFVCVTNHNTCFENAHLPRRGDLTVIPGAEWTHYKGHANFLGVQTPYKNPFCVNTPDEARAVMAEAKANGAFIVVNHPFCAPECGWRWGMDLHPFDALEVWNGALMDGYNLRCLAWCHARLCEDARIPVVGGSDFHREGAMALPGLPVTCVYALSRSRDDLLAAIVAGHAFIAASPDAPTLDMRVGEMRMGDIAPADTEVALSFRNLRGGDVLRLITDRDETEIPCAPNTLERSLVHRVRGARFLRCEVLRQLLPDLPPTRVLVANPIYFAREE